MIFAEGHTFKFITKDFKSSLTQWHEPRAPAPVKFWQEDQPSPRVWDQHGQHSKTISKEKFIGVHIERKGTVNLSA